MESNRRSILKLFAAAPVVALASKSLSDNELIEVDKVDYRLRATSVNSSLAEEYKNIILSLSSDITDVEMVSGYNEELDFSWLRMSLVKNKLPWNEVIERTRFDITSGSIEGQRLMYETGLCGIKRAIDRDLIVGSSDNRDMRGKIKRTEMKA